ncbi:MAG: hypothetical protein COS82_10190 [Zetaproteobacteria bacterium CG06_land_8_20_14_3_00_59_53]|nr:MAG: hypothetical protein AUK36_02165 [Zetaproteobacteria bacterium CG2_30_59_37]PIQ65500.1 MAG: hypothetical protein COV97_03995 [Zetaproteobacteria bacterium CG11_big_fil_rev_8_21_14_0_20_59_439]PIU69752.1 MAG: hypothetical protein COS82_10190 [Zetaproteobacteria bacterium CG06_land_8_20_14_3_00_59_53]PIU97001.1 MAG: hypothetical protein COS62_06320 [Zetaproteobacteria bacterium CG03_land_8_20_14_0_80_59_51]PIY47667.1 MAG: hypothetical protein COZ02_01565 [Zetaproteobacteria bacterium CG_4
MMIAALLLMPLLLATKAEAAPLYEGTAIYTLPNSTLVTMNWAIDNPGTNGAAYRYRYQLIGTSNNSAQTFDFTALTGVTSITQGGSSRTPGITNFTQTPSSGVPVTGLSSLQSTFVTPATATASTWAVNLFWDSNVTPVTSGSVTINNVTISGIGPSGAAGAGAATPGAPEPQTWALLITLMGFATFWLRRRQDDEQLQASIAA